MTVVVRFSSVIPGKLDAPSAKADALRSPNSMESLAMSQVTIAIDEQDLPTVLAMLRERGIAVAQPELQRSVGGQVGETDEPPQGREVGGQVGSADDEQAPSAAKRQS